MELFHYTSKDGFKSISSQMTWLFRATKPPGGHRLAAYFTDYDERTKNLALKLRIPKRKLAYFFKFDDGNHVQSRVLKRLPGARGRHIFYSEADYPVEPGRQIYRGPRPSEAHQ